MIDGRSTTKQGSFTESVSWPLQRWLFWHVATLYDLNSSPGCSSEGAACSKLSRHWFGGRAPQRGPRRKRSEEHTSELQSLRHLVCRLLLEKKNNEDKMHINLS